ncbi:MAG: type II toxin-antitoxin system RelE/ParE family toxin [Anaerolineaceae bacterium]|nr:type II toxin-antitoxin system RelE/ParE family toxin [Anaerolineaceae bacterium]
MIRSFRHRGLKRFYERGDRSGINPQHVDKIKRILALFDVANSPEDMRLPSLRLHALRGDRAGYHAVVVRANWRITFRFEHGDVYDVDLVDYH